MRLGRPIIIVGLSVLDLAVRNVLLHVQSHTRVNYCPRRLVLHWLTGLELAFEDW